jgi:hypothetical protein
MLLLIQQDDDLFSDRATVYHDGWKERGMVSEFCQSLRNASQNVSELVPDVTDTSRESSLLAILQYAIRYAEVLPVYSSLLQSIAIGSRLCSRNSL